MSSKYKKTVLLLRHWTEKFNKASRDFWYNFPAMNNI